MSDLTVRSAPEADPASVAGIRGIRPFPLTKHEADILALLMRAGDRQERHRLTRADQRSVTQLYARLEGFRSGSSSAPLLPGLATVALRLEGDQLSGDQPEPVRAPDASQLALGAL